MSECAPNPGAGWRKVGGVALSSLADTRLQMHWAVQAVASAANTLLPKRPGDSHANLGWVADLQALVSHPFPGPVRAGLAFDDPALLLLDGRDRIAQRLPLNGRTLDETIGWLAGALGGHAGDDVRNHAPAPLLLPDYDMPDHPVRSGAVFTLEADDALAELARWFGNAQAALSAIAATEPGSSPLRCWPHHFDIGLLVVLDRKRGAEDGPSIGAGLSPGDGGTGEPYFYVNPYPRPEGHDLPTLEGGGSWNTESWFGAILRASRIARHATPEAQSAAAGRFLDSAVGACRGLLGGRNDGRAGHGSG